jgi:tartrate dehydrogenase/decarboxylase/D-malate dehydrogenase
LNIIDHHQQKKRGIFVKNYKIAVLSGDGVGPEVVPEGVRVLQAVSRATGDFGLVADEFPWGSEHYMKYGQMMPDDALDILKRYDAIFLGAIGHPDIPDHIGVGQIIFKIRQGFNQYVNLRPIKLLPGIDCPLKNKKMSDIDMLFIRENTEGEYGNIGGTFMARTSRETVLQTNIFTRYGTERAMRYAFEQAGKRKGKLTSVTKSNALKHSMVFWDEVFADLSKQYPQVQTRKVLVDAMAMFMVLKPEQFDVVVASNLFGDILTDLGAGLQGGLGFAPGGNINPEKEFPSMFEPIHGSAPDIAGQGIANPIATVWAGQMMLQHLGEDRGARVMMSAIEQVCAEGKVKTPDMGGCNSTTEMADAIAQKVAELAQAVQ